MVKEETQPPTNTLPIDRNDLVSQGEVEPSNPNPTTTTTMMMRAPAHELQPQHQEQQQLGDGSNSNNNNLGMHNMNNERNESDTIGPNKRMRKEWLAYVGRRQPRVGNDFQVAILPPMPAAPSTTTTAVAVESAASTSATPVSTTTTMNETAASRVSITTSSGVDIAAAITAGEATDSQANASSNGNPAQKRRESDAMEYKARQPKASSE